MLQLFKCRSWRIHQSRIIYCIEIPESHFFNSKESTTGMPVVDKQAKKTSNEANKNAIKKAKELREAIIAEAMSVFRISYDQPTTDYVETNAKSRETVIDADEIYKEVKKQADIVYKKVKKGAGDKQAKKEGAKDRKKTIAQAKKVRDKATHDLR